MDKLQKNDNPSVSIVTITQYSRRKCLTNLAELIKKQVYRNITEWVIVDGSHHSADAIANEKYIISQWKTLTLLPFNLEIVYIPFVKKQYLSDLRNIGNNACHGDIIVCMDDDDYSLYNNSINTQSFINHSNSRINMIENMIYLLRFVNNIAD